jgi:hypothetical protein
MKKLLFSLILLTFAFAQTGETQTGESEISNAIAALKSNMSLITLIILFTFVLAGFSYSFGKILNIGSIKAWAKDQIYESLLSLFIGLLAIFILENFFLNQNFNSVLSSAKLLPEKCADKTDLFEIDECELKLFLNKISDFLWNVFSIDLLFNALSNFYVQLKLSFLETIYTTVKLPLLAFLFNDLSDAIGTMYLTLLIAFILNSFQIYLLKVAPYLFLFLFPAGVVLRSFGLTRKIGGSLIAISVGFSLLFPILVAVGYGYILSNYKLIFIESLAQDFESLWIYLTGNTISLIASWFNLSVLSTITLILSYIPSVISLITIGVLPLFFGNFNFIAPIILGLLIVPYIIFDVLENFIRGFSSQIGQPVSVIGWIGRLL